MPTRSRGMGRLGATLKPTFNMSAFEDSLASWEEEINKYEKETSSQLSSDLKIAVLMNETKGRLQEHLRLHSGSIKTYSEIRDVILNYYRSQEAFRGPSPMDVGWMQWKGHGKGKGKGKEKGKWNPSGWNHQQGKGDGKPSWNGHGNGYNNWQNQFQQWNQPS